MWGRCGVCSFNWPAVFEIAFEAYAPSCQGASVSTCSPLPPLSLQTNLRGEDIVSYWKRKMPLGAAFVGRPKGRTIRALATVALRLGSTDEGVTESNMLKAYEGKCRLAAKLHPKIIDGIGFDDIKSILTMLSSENVQPTVELLTKAIEKRSSLMIRAADFPGLVSVLTPFAMHAPFDPLSIKSSAIPSIGPRTSLFERFVIHKAVIPTIMEGEEKLTTLRELAVAGLAMVADIDVFDLEAGVTDCFATASVIFRALLAILDMDCEQEAVESVVSIKASMLEKGDRSVMAAVGTALESIAFYQRRMDTMLQAQPMLVQHGPSIAEAHQILKNLPDDMKECGPLLLKACQTFKLASQDVPEEFIENLSTELKGVFNSRCASWLPWLQSVESIELWREARDLLKEAVSLFPGERPVEVAFDEVTKKLETCDISGRVGDLRTALTQLGGFTDMTDELQYATLNKVLECLDALSGVAIPNEVRTMIKGSIGPLLSNYFCNYDALSLTFARALAMWSPAVELLADPEEGKLLELALAEHTFRYRVVKIDGDFDANLVSASSQEVADFRGFAKRVETKYNNVKSIDLSAFWSREVGTYMQKVEASIKAGREFVEKAAAAEKAAKESEHMKNWESAIGIPGASTTSPAWYAKVGIDAPLEVIQGEASKLFKDLEAKKIKLLVADLKKSAGELEECLRSQGAVVMPDFIDRVPDVSKRLLGIASTMQLLFHFGRSDEGDVRSLITLEVRELRDAQMREKDYLPSAVFARARQILTKPKQ